MSKIIEITGPPSVGKTTIYKELSRRWDKESSWAPKSEFIPKVSKAKFGTTDYLIIKTRKIFAKPLFDEQTIKEGSYKFLKDNPEFVSLCWKLIDKNRKQDHLGVDNRFRSAFYLYSVFGTYQSIVDSDDQRICVTDELLIHRIIQITSEQLNTNDISLFAQYVPLPDTLILLDAPAEVLTQRSMERERKIIRHENKSLEGLIELAEIDRKRLKLTANNIEKRGVKLLTIDTTNSLEHSVQSIINFLSN